MTLNAAALSAAPTTLDFRSAALATWGTEARKTIGAALALWAGNVLVDASIRYTGSGNDRDPILVNVGSTTPNNTRTQQLP
jgi:hypothetical protein